MSQENVEIIKSAGAAFRRGDLRALEEAYAPDIEWRDLQPAPDVPSLAHGIEAVKRIWSDWLHAFPDLRVDASEYIDLGETVICVVHWHGMGEGSGVPVDFHSVDVYELQEGKIVRVTFGYQSREDALEAAGLSE